MKKEDCQKGELDLCGSTRFCSSVQKVKSVPIAPYHLSPTTGAAPFIHRNARGHYWMTSTLWRLFYAKHHTYSAVYRHTSAKYSEISPRTNAFCRWESAACHLGTFSGTNASSVGCWRRWGGVVEKAAERETEHVEEIPTYICDRIKQSSIACIYVFVNSSWTIICCQFICLIILL